MSMKWIRVKSRVWLYTIFLNSLRIKFTTTLIQPKRRKCVISIGFFVYKIECNLRQLTSTVPSIPGFQILLLGRDRQQGLPQLGDPHIHRVQMFCKMYAYIERERGGEREKGRNWN